MMVQYLLLYFYKNVQPKEATPKGNMTVDGICGGITKNLVKAIVKGNDAQKDLVAGDIDRIHHNEHHFMVIEPVKSGYIRSFEGNAGAIKHEPLLAANWMGNATHNVVGDIYMRYRVIS